MNYQMLVDKKSGLSKDYIPSNLVDVNSKYKEGIKLEATAYENWLNLKNKLFDMGYVVDIESGYRSYEYQKEVLEEVIAEKGLEHASVAVASPGHSEHQTGLSLDYTVFKNKEFVIENDMYELDECEVINSIVQRYGFIVRYPKGKENITGYMFELWHLRYVGVDLATHLHENNMTLDEYYSTK